MDAHHRDITAVDRDGRRRQTQATTGSAQTIATTTATATTVTTTALIAATAALTTGVVTAVMTSGILQSHRARPSLTTLRRVGISSRSALSLVFAVAVHTIWRGSSYICGVLQVLGSHEFESRTDLPFERVLGAQAPRTKYRRRRGETKTVIHWGQRKLLLSEVEFLTKYARSGTTVVYAGAAPGTHTSFLIRLFPHVSFVLVDPAPFSRRLCESERVHLRQELFTDAIAAEFAGQSDILFVSDVRSCDWQLLSDSEVEKQVEDDMAAQMRWHDIIKPRHSMLKFRLSWNAGETEYLDGEIFLPIWGPITTTEARLITPENSTARRMWVNTTYEEQMFHFLRWALIRLVSAPMSASAGDTSVVESSICLRLCKLLRGQCSGGCSSGGFFGL
eukprot:m.221324 g.221324  ORF g.221324 m.221324 type:complete len:391 (+) comp10805_c2_seq16:525-1697(+)